VLLLQQRPIITLTTDFGHKDYFVGSLKGVILGINQHADIVSISHDVRSYDIRGGAYIIRSAYRYFPRFSIHVGIVDPGVGSPRRPILVVSNNYYFIGPDNGIFSYIYKEDPPVKVIEIKSEHYFLKSGGATFHGRDIFAPVAAWLSKGVEYSNLGDEITDFKAFPIPEINRSDQDSIKGEIVYIDKFGNLISNITRNDLDQLVINKGNKGLEVRIKDQIITGLKDFYGQGEANTIGAIINSNGYLEIFANMKSAKEALKVSIGEEITVAII
jgi:S-adenosylmethionine hydrolase